MAVMIAAGGVRKTATKRMPPMVMSTRSGIRKRLVMVLTAKNARMPTNGSRERARLATAIFEFFSFFISNPTCYCTNVRKIMSFNIFVNNFKELFFAL